MDFVNGLPRISYDSNNVGVIMDQLTESTYFISILIFFSFKRLAFIYIHDIVCLHGVLNVYYLKFKFSVHISLLKNHSERVGCPGQS